MSVGEFVITYDLTQCGALPRYEYLYRCIRRDIQDGVLQANEKLPSKRTLSQHLSVSVTTIETAYAILVSEGYIYSKNNSGFFVCANQAKGQFQPDAFDQEPQEPEQRIDFKANKCSLSLFPMNTWARLMRQVLSNQDPVLLQTVPYNGLYVLRRAIAAYLYEFKGMRVSPSQIIIGAGTEYLYARLIQLFGPQSVIAMEDPGYKKFSDISNSHGTVWDYIPMDEYGMRIDLLARSRANIVHVSPANHFPTGIVMPAERRQELLDWADASPLRYIIEDDYDSELRFSGQALPTIFSQDAQQKVIYLNTFSKTLVPSLRISYMVLPPALKDIYRQQLSFYSCTVSSFEQYVLAKFIAEGYFERHINRLKRYYKRQNAQIIQAIGESPLSGICDVQKCQVGTHLILRINTKLSDSEIHQAAQARGIELSLLSDYCHYPSASYFRQIVLNFASLDPENIKLAVELLVDIFQQDIDMKK